MSIIVEIRAAAGGDDSKDIVNLQYNIYTKYAKRNNIEIELLDDKSGIIVFKCSGKNVKKCFETESGCIRWQRVPPTEKRGRVHTSTITVAILEIPKWRNRADISSSILEKDLQWSFTRGSGAGGQHRNKTDTAAILVHLSSGIRVRSESSKSQYQNKQIALDILSAKLYELEKYGNKKDIANKRKKQIGAGMRAEKTRTVRLQDGLVINHLNGKQISSKNYLRGMLELLQ